MKTSLSFLGLFFFGIMLVGIATMIPQQSAHAACYDSSKQPIPCPKSDKSNYILTQDAKKLAGPSSTQMPDTATPTATQTATATDTPTATFTSTVPASATSTPVSAAVVAPGAPPTSTPPTAPPGGFPLLWIALVGVVVIALGGLGLIRARRLPGSAGQPGSLEATGSEGSTSADGTQPHGNEDEGGRDTGDDGGQPDQGVGHPAFTPSDGAGYIGKIPVRPGDPPTEVMGGPQVVQSHSGPGDGGFGAQGKVLGSTQTPENLGVGAEHNTVGTVDAEGNVVHFEDGVRSGRWDWTGDDGQPRVATQTTVEDPNGGKDHVYITGDPLPGETRKNWEQALEDPAGETQSAADQDAELDKQSQLAASEGRDIGYSITDGDHFDPGQSEADIASERSKQDQLNDPGEGTRSIDGWEAPSGPADSEAGAAWSFGPNYSEDDAGESGNTSGRGSSGDDGKGSGSSSSSGKGDGSSSSEGKNDGSSSDGGKDDGSDSSNDKPEKPEGGEGSMGTPDGAGGDGNSGMRPGMFGGDGGGPGGSSPDADLERAERPGGLDGSGDGSSSGGGEGGLDPNSGGQAGGLRPVAGGGRLAPSEGVGTNTGDPIA